MPYKQFTPVTLTASDVNTYLMKQSVMVFATAAARATALPLPDEGMVTYIAATDVMEFYDGTNWVRTGTPAGVVSSFAGSTAPTGWLLCYGQAVSRTTYADLFASLGTTYGAGNGSTTFNLPDLRGRVAAGRDVDMSGSGGTGLQNRLTSGVSGVAGGTLGATGGNQSMQQHQHPNSATFTGSAGTTGNDSPDHAHLQRSGGSLNVSFGVNSGLAYNHTGGTPLDSNMYTAGATARHQHSYTPAGSVTVTNADAGTGTSQNVQPTIVMNYIIKV